MGEVDRLHVTVSEVEDDCDKYYYDSPAFIHENIKQVRHVVRAICIDDRL